MKQATFASLSFDAKKKRAPYELFWVTWIGGAMGSGQWGARRWRCDDER